MCAAFRISAIEARPQKSAPSSLIVPLSLLDTVYHHCSTPTASRKFKLVADEPLCLLYHPAQPHSRPGHGNPHRLDDQTTLKRSDRCTALFLWRLSCHNAPVLSSGSVLLGPLGSQFTSAAVAQIHIIPHHMALSRLNHQI